MVLVEERTKLKFCMYSYAKFCYVGYSIDLEILSTKVGDVNSMYRRKENIYMRVTSYVFMTYSFVTW
jgi:hypothetical protein